MAFITQPKYLIENTIKIITDEIDCIKSELLKPASLTYHRYFTLKIYLHNLHYKLNHYKQLLANKEKEIVVYDLVQFMALKEEDFKYVVELHLVKEELSGFPENILLMKNLRFLDLSNNSITFIPVEVTKLKRLERLRLSYNQITFINLDLISYFKKLKYLELKGNKLFY